MDVPWAPTLGLRLDLALDGLGVLYALLATGIGAAVFTYGAAYLPWHLAHEDRPAREDRRFWPWMVLFMGAMVGLACARDLDPAVRLLRPDRGRVVLPHRLRPRPARGARRGAHGAAGDGRERGGDAHRRGAALHGVRHLLAAPALRARRRRHHDHGVAAALIAVAALAKSAQVPLHFWLPRAMAAPTPVSAYLHSAAMVAAGVLVLGRVHPLLRRQRRDPGRARGRRLRVDRRSAACSRSSQDELKQILAHSTISQYGYVVVLYGIGGAEGRGRRRALRRSRTRSPRARCS